MIVRKATTCSVKQACCVIIIKQAVMKKEIVSLALILGSLYSCQKNQTVYPGPSGNYNGSLRTVTPTSTLLLSSQVQVSLQDGHYQSSSASNATSKGTYSAKDNVLLFTDSTAHNTLMNWDFLLNGAFATSTKGDSVVWTKTIGNISYVYTLKKQ